MALESYGGRDALQALVDGNINVTILGDATLAATCGENVAGCRPREGGAIAATHRQTSAELATLLVHETGHTNQSQTAIQFAAEEVQVYNNALDFLQGLPAGIGRGRYQSAVAWRASNPRGFNAYIFNQGFCYWRTGRVCR